MRIPVLVSFLLLLIATQAQTQPAQDAEMLQKMKAEVTENLNQRIRNLETAKTCVQSAADAQALRTCHQQIKEEMKELQQATKERRKELREEMRKRRKQNNEAEKAEKSES